MTHSLQTSITPIDVSEAAWLASPTRWIAPKCQDGQSLVEYSLIIAFVALGVAGALLAFGVALNGYYLEDIIAMLPF